MRTRRQPSRPARSTPWSRSERGSGTVLMAGVMAVVGVFFATGLLVAGYLVAAHRARAVADLSALSGAGAFQQGFDPCAQARRTAHGNGGRLTRCDQVGDLVNFVVTVTAVVDVPTHIPGLPRAVSAQANAGPTGGG